MGSFKEDTFNAIREDYNEREETSFLYRYIKDHKCEEISKALKKGKMSEKTIIKKKSSEQLQHQGYPVSGGTVPLKKRESNNFILDLVAAWYDTGKGITYGSNGSFSGEFDPEPYQLLYDKLNEENVDTAFIPVRIDPETGIGIFIVGKYHFKNFREFYDNPSLTCGICLMEWMEPKETGDTNLKILLDASSCHSNIEEANEFYVGAVNSDKFDFFQSCNDERLRDIPEMSYKYFLLPEEDSFSLTDEDLQEAKEMTEK